MNPFADQKVKQLAKNFEAAESSDTLKRSISPLPKPSHLLAAKLDLSSSNIESQSIANNETQNMSKSPFEDSTAPTDISRRIQKLELASLDSSPFDDANSIMQPVLDKYSSPPRSIPTIPAKTSAVSEKDAMSNSLPLNNQISPAINSSTELNRNNVTSYDPNASPKRQPPKPPSNHHRTSSASQAILPNAPGGKDTGFHLKSKSEINVDPFADQDEGSSSDSVVEELLPPEKFALPPKLPPRPSNSSILGSTGTLIGQAPPPLPSRPVSSKSSSSDQLDDKYAGLKAKENLQYPVTKHMNRRPPIADYFQHPEIHIGRSKALAFSGLNVVSLYQSIKVYFTATSEVACNINNPDQKSQFQTICFIHSKNIKDEGRYLWASTDKGDLYEIDVESGQIIDKKAAHNGALSHIIVQNFNVYTLDEHGGLKIWFLDESGRCCLNGRPRGLRVSPKVAKAHVVGKHMWCITGKQVEIYNLDEMAQTLLERRFDVGVHLAAISCLSVSEDRNEVFLGHEDGKISVYDSTTFQKKKVVVVAQFYGLKSILAIGNILWVGFGTGKISIFDMKDESWLLLKEFPAYHNTPVVDIQYDETSLLFFGRLNVVTISESGQVKLWDGFLTRDKIDLRLKDKSLYTKTVPLQLLILTWNIDSRKPSDMDSGDYEDRNILKDLISNNQSSQLFVIGFQELVDLESKSVTAKSLLIGNNQKDANIDQRFKLWQDRLHNIFAEVCSQHFIMLECRQLVGLFQCIIYKGNPEYTPKEISVSLVKTGLGGFHGNKGAIVTRCLIKDSSFCFVNCHLAAHQNQSSSRNNDIANIIKEANFPKLAKEGIWCQGGDGSQLLDHSYIFWSGDLNYRLDMTRRAALDAIERCDFPTLWENDQLLKQKQENVYFGLRDFKEPLLQFPPTFKYDRGTRQYDSSEKMRIPAYCDRILYKGDIVNNELKRLECKISDHRPVYGRFTVNIEKINQELLNKLIEKATEEIEIERNITMNQDKVKWLMNCKNLGRNEAELLLEQIQGNLGLVN